MLASISTIGTLFMQGAKLMENPTVKKSVSGVVSWMKDLFPGNKRMKERLELIEQGKATEEAVKALQTSLDDLAYDNEELTKQLEEKVKEVEKVMKTEGITNITKTTTANITGNNNINLQDLSGNSNINLNIGKD